ncbi:MAG: CvpA family protein [Burkholderiaceae bacterium]|nr:CvpA family protein [Burkholderiaceae bacterium]
MATLDWIFMAVLLASMLIGAWRGLVFEMVSLVAWVCAFWVAQWWAADLGALLPLGESGPALRYAAGFLGVFALALFAGGFVSWLGKQLVTAMGLRPADRALGAIFGVLRGLVLLLVVAVVAGLTPVHEADWWQESQGVPWLGQALKGLKPALPEEFGRHLPS